MTFTSIVIQVTFVRSTYKRLWFGAGTGTCLERHEICVSEHESEIFLRQYASFQFPSFPFQLAIRSLGAHITKERVCFNNKHIVEVNVFRCSSLFLCNMWRKMVHSSKGYTCTEVRHAIQCSVTFYFFILQNSFCRNSTLLGFSFCPVLPCMKHLQKGVVWCRHWHMFGEVWDLCIWAWECEENTVVIYM